MGFYVAITNNTNKPLIKCEGIEVSTGASTNIGISRTFYKKLPTPYGKCRNDVDSPLSTDSDYYKYTLRMGKYTRNQCFEVCFQYKYAIEKCKCADGSVDSNLNKTSVCFTDKDLNCLEKQRVKNVTRRVLSHARELIIRIEFQCHHPREKF